MGLFGTLGYRFLVLNGATATPTSKIFYSRDTRYVFTLYRRISLISYKLLLIILISLLILSYYARILTCCNYPILLQHFHILLVFP